MYQLKITAEKDTESFVQFLTHELDDELLDELEVDRSFSATSKLVSEPITTSVLLATVSIACITTVARLLERWMEIQRQKKHLEILASVLVEDTKAGEIIAGTINKYSEVSISYKLSEFKNINQ